MKQVITLIFILFFNSNLLACYCSYSEFEPNHYFNSKYIFEGEVTKVEECRVYFKIIENYKGNLTDENAYTDTKCDYYCGIMATFEVGQKWIMWGGEKDGTPFYTDGCSRSSIKSKKRDFEIGEIKKLSTIKGYKKFYSKDSILIAEGKVNRQQREGEWKFYDQYGFPKQIATFKNNRIVRQSILFHIPSKHETLPNEFVPQYVGKVKSIKKYDKNRDLESSRIYNQNGNLIVQQLYKNGKKHGHNFANHYSSYYTNGLKNGKYRINHYKTDQIKIEGEFRNGKPVGIFNYYDNGGELIYQLKDEYIEYKEVLNKIENER
jgi:antitoxin component YwqK of YwqJK toxin-antitoxin module